MNPVRIYTTTWCGYCTAAKRFFQARNIPYEEIDLTTDPEGRADLEARTGRRTVPQIFIGEVHVGGYTDLRALDAQGRLEPLLKRAS